jgi:hypothetical protein
MAPNKKVLVTNVRKTGAKVPPSWNARMMTSAKGKPKTGTIPVNRTPSTPKPTPASTPSPRITVPAEWNARMMTSAKGKPKAGTIPAPRKPANKPAAPKPAAPKPAAKPAAKPANKPAAKPANKPAAKPAAKPFGQFRAPSVPKPGTATKPQGTPDARAWFEQNKPSARLNKQMNAQQLANLSYNSNQIRQGLAPVASLLGGLRSVAFDAIKDVVTPRSFADSTLSAQAPQIAKQIANMQPNANTSRFAGARDKAFAKAKDIKGSPVVGSKPASAPKASAPKASAPKASAPKASAPKGSAPKAAAPKASAPKASAPSGPVRMSASTYNRVSGNYGTSSTNNPLMADFKDSLPRKAADPDVGYSPKTKVSSKNIKGAPTDVTKLAFSNPKLSAERTRKIKRG